MESLKFDLTKTHGKFRPMNAVNNGPIHKRHANDQFRSNFNEYKAARIPYSRNHDSQMCGIYGGPYSHDITAIFPRFEADVNDPASYDFEFTDRLITALVKAGIEPYYRLGVTIENQSAIKLAKKLGKGKTVVTVLPDTAERYFSTSLFD